MADDIKLILESGVNVVAGEGTLVQAVPPPRPLPQKTVRYRREAKRVYGSDFSHADAFRHGTVPLQDSAFFTIRPRTATGLSRHKHPNTDGNALAR
jgi:hypothetical protein